MTANVGVLVALQLLLGLLGLAAAVVSLRRLGTSVSGVCLALGFTGFFALTALLPPIKALVMAGTIDDMEEMWRTHNLLVLSGGISEALSWGLIGVGLATLPSSLVSRRKKSLERPTEF